MYMISKGPRKSMVQQKGIPTYIGIPFSIDAKIYLVFINCPGKDSQAKLRLELVNVPEPVFERLG